MSNATKPAAVKPFKSARAAQMAMTKAERAYNAASCAHGSAYRDAMESDHVDPIAAMDAAARVSEAAFDFAAAVYAQANAQGFWVRSWRFAPNATRDLIAANID